MLVTLAMLLSLSTAPTLQSSINTGTTEVDVELILAVDVSRSMDWDELQVQRAGYVAALQHPDFINAIEDGLIGRIAVAYYEWAGGVYTDAVVDWQIISNAEEAASFAAKLQAKSQSGLRGTSISSAIEFGADLFNQNDYRGLRRVIDISGDGPNNRGLPIIPSRDKAVSAGIVINGLAIMIRPSVSMVPLDKYYADCVIGGPGAFVLPVKDIEDFAPAIRRKLVMEISGLVPAEAVPASTEAPTDCMIGEKIRNDWDNR